MKREHVIGMWINLNDGFSVTNRRWSGKVTAYKFDYHVILTIDTYLYTSNICRWVHSAMFPAQFYL